MAVTLVYRFAGPTIGLSIGNTSHAAVTINSIDPSANGLLICNTSTSEVMYVTVNSSPTNGTLVAAAAASIPGDGTAGSFPVLAYDDFVISGIDFPVSVTAISSIAGPNLMTVTPVVLM